MQIDLANILVHKAYFYLLCIVHHCPQARAPLLWRGRGRLSPSLWEGLGVGFPFQPFLYSFACFITPLGHNPGFFYTFVDLKT